MTEQQKRYGVGVVGLDHWYAGIAAVDGLKGSTYGTCVAVAHRDEERLRAFAAERGVPHATTDYAEVVRRDDVDVVVTACTTAENVDLCLEAVRLGKPIVSVKPFVMSLQDADRLVRAVKEKGTPFISLDSSHRVNAVANRFKVWIGEGRIGKPVSATIVQRATVEGASQDWPGRRSDKTWWLDPSKVPGGGWLDHAIYQVDYLRWLFDAEVARVSGVSKTLVHPELPPELEDYGNALLEFDNGAVASVEVTWTAKPGRGLSVTQIVGSEGQLVHDATLTGKVSVTGNFDSPGGDGWTTIAAPGGRAAGGLVEHLLECLATGKQPVATIDDSRKTLAVCLAFYEAARAGKTVSL